MRKNKMKLLCSRKRSANASSTTMAVVQKMMMPYVTPHDNLLTREITYVTPHDSLLTCKMSYVRPRDNLLTRKITCVTPRGKLLTHKISHVTPHGSLLTCNEGFEHAFGKLGNTYRNFLKCLQIRRALLGESDDT